MPPISSLPFEVFFFTSFSRIKKSGTLADFHIITHMATSDWFDHRVCIFFICADYDGFSQVKSLCQLLFLLQLLLFLLLLRKG
ncbi:hypothetical protein BCR42DRAFT_400267 [Absidia repens]|uniref:Uncharacterized protein n=1 Tax=Absidia repens TaxID=90262 RepID=A0A1X2J0V0_9FUNG|nr:hypothetical protein BCR42DRAFT_400267 [Absidia repens]